MHYEEKIEDGKLYFRFSSVDDWALVDYEKLLDRYIETQNEMYDLTKRRLEEVGRHHEQIEKEIRLLKGILDRDK